MVNFINPDIQLGNEFMKTPLSIRRTALRFTLAVFCLAVSAMATPLQLVTTVDPAVGPPASGGGNSMNPIITPNGRYVLFASTANNLALTSSNTPFPAQSPPKINVLLRDRTNGTTTLVSINLAGTGGGNGDSMPIELSTNGQYALFESTASDLVPGDTNNATDVFVRDLVHGTNILVSIGMDGSFANGASRESTMTPDGRYVAFASTAINLAFGDANGIQNVFVRDLQTGVTMLASPDAIWPGSSDSPQITPDGRYVAFLSTARGLVRGVTTTGEVYVRDLTGSATYLASTNAHAAFTNIPVPIVSYNHAISDNGRFVAFESSINGSSGGGIIQRYDLQTGLTGMVYTNAVAGPIGYSLIRNLDMTPDGRFIAFVANTNSGSGVFLWDAQTATTTLVSGDSFYHTVPAGSVCDWPVVDPSGRFVAFLSDATGLATNIVAGDFHLYLRDLLAGTTALLDADTNGFGFPKDFMNPARLTPNGRYVVFDCSDEMPATNIYNQSPAFADSCLVPGDNNQAYDVFLRDLTTNTIELISARQPALPSQSPSDSSPALVFSVDTGGRYVAFASASCTLVPNDTNTYRGVFVHDLLTGTNLLVSADSNGLANANSMSTDPSISADGRYVAFTSYASNLVAGYTKPLDYPSGIGSSDVFVRDLQTGVTRLVSLSADGTSAGNSNSYSPVISSDGRYVLFSSWANNLSMADYFNPRENLSLRDLQSGTTYTLGYGSRVYYTPTIMNSAMTPDGRFIAFYGYVTSSSDTPNLYVWDSQAAALIYTNASWATNITISPDGNRIVYSGPGTELYAVDRAANTNWQISTSLPCLRAGLQFSGDSRFLVYSTTDAQVGFDINGVADVYLYDFVTQSNFLVSQGDPPGAANGPSDSPAISNDGRFVAYRSTATNLVAGATNGLPNIFLYDRQTGTTTLLSANASGMAGNNRSFAPQFSGDGATVVFQSWASDLIAQDFNQVNNLIAVKIAASPTIASPPTNQTVFVGGTVTFTVTATGSPLNYQWQFNGTTISGATGSYYTLTNVQPNQAGIYSVVVSNAAGSVASLYSVLRVWTPSSVVAWGDDDAGQTDVPAGLTNAVAVAAGASHSLALKADGTVVAWGDSWYGETEVPSDLTNGVAIAAGDDFSLALRSDGTVVGWGFDDDGEIDVPVDLANVVAIAAGDSFSLALKADGTVVAWGEDSYGQTNVPSDLTNVVAVAGGWYHSLALKTDGTVVAWGDDSYGQTNVPMDLTNGVAVAAGAVHSLALKTDGTVAAWGHEWGAIPMDLTNGVAIAGGVFHSLALKADSTVAAWGYNWHSYGETNVPSGLTNVVAIAAGGFHNLALAGNQPPLMFPPDHFAWNPIPSPRFVNTPFAVTIQAQDVANGLFTNFTGAAILGTTNGVAVTPSVSGSFVQGVWTGSVVISQTASNLVLRADDGLGHFGLANPINVISLPSLGMVRSGNFALFMWPVGYSGFVLEASGSLSPATWALIPYAPFQIGDQYLIPLEMTGTNGFYRLRFPGP
jgi:Tol biopolymer transport system component/alpha-tubulin suppressor-like RCC1 family protein